MSSAFFFFLWNHEHVFWLFYVHDSDYFTFFYYVLNYKVNYLVSESIFKVFLIFLVKEDIGRA